ncbi:P-loop NTPase fold protein [Actinomycetospora lemnae]|uniref:P-loop NTPase fold protein n=1 Tax=Actinomycetospora lemnae TaxID=3019891 RepID=A0ABT5SWQ2_9PSEU|nr:P-loop NTPase fold protein [Actinomycetospora sp. DW7H6]MDD7966571.1 P-loop NTPase fold protein [Actinomycetospora sp. DW7H6]
MVSEPWSGHNGAVWSVAVSPEGARVVSGGQDGSVRVWDMATGVPVGDPWIGHKGGVRSVAVSPDGSRVLSGGEDGSVRVWDLATGVPVGDPWLGHQGRVLSVAVSPDSSWVFTGSQDGSVRVWELATGVPVGDPWLGHQGRVLSVAVSPDGSRVITGGADESVRVWDVVSGDPVGDPWLGHQGRVWSVAVSPHGSRVVSGGDGAVRVWDMATGVPVGDPWTGHTGGVWSVAMSPDGSRVVSGGDGSVRVWDVATGASMGHPWTGHQGPVLAVVVSPDGSRVVTGGDDGSVRVWSWEESRPTSTVHRYAGVRSDVAGVEDLLGMGPDATTVAALLAAVETEPPLSVALLGNWGSGKSTFMRLVQAQVASFAEIAQHHPNSAYAAHVRQVQFNAWHYSDDHLWVGLVEHLFRELSDKTPAPPADDQDRHRLEEQLAQQKVEKARLDNDLRRIDDLDPQRGWWGWIGQFHRSMLVVRAFGAEARTQLHRKLWLPAALLVLAIVLATVTVLVGDTVAATIRGVLGLTGVAALLGAVRARVTAAWTVARDLTESNRSRLLADQTERAERIVELERQLTERDPARQLNHLLSEITAPDRYGGYRGLTGRIHDDLRRLSDQLAAARKRDRLALRRIILYVDDLDRCVSRRVVEVLQAVNLLLSMDLFVVVVAVDPRWLLGALDEQHGHLLNIRSTTAGQAFDPTNHGGRSQPLDYLDKIFHLSYAVPPMSGHATTYLRDLLPTVEPNTDGEQRTPTAKTSVHSASAPRSGAGPDMAPTAPAASTTQTAADATSTPAGGVPPSAELDSAEVTMAVPELPPPPEVQSLYLQPHEANFLPKLAPLVPTPRGVKKLANTYRLLRISVPDNALGAFLGDREHGGPYQAAALLLTAIIANPGHARRLLDELGAAQPEPDVVDTLTAIGGPLASQLAAFVADVRRESPVHGSTVTYQRWIGPVARHSFDTYDLFTGDTNRGQGGGTIRGTG